MVLITDNSQFATPTILAVDKSAMLILNVKYVPAPVKFGFDEVDIATVKDLLPGNNVIAEVVTCEPLELYTLTNDEILEL